MWLLLAILSAFILGFYDISKKVSLQENAVIPTLFFSTVTASIVMLILVGLSTSGIISTDHRLFVPAMTVAQHIHVLIKTVIVLICWILTYFATKNLPLTIVGPIQTTGPLWTLIGALLIFDEKLNIYQASGVVTILVFFYLLSSTGKIEGVSFRSNKYVWFLILGTLFASISSLYDRYLLREMDVMAVQAYFTFYQTLLLIPVLLFLWYPKRKSNTAFKWRWTIPMVGILLLIGDYFYFYSLSLPDSLISIVSIVRRSNVVIVFLFGALFYKEKNILRKGIYLVGIVLGLILLILGRE